VEVTNVFTNKKIIYPTIKEAASELDVHLNMVKIVLKKKKPY
jgi:hypothetical protein